MHRRTLLNFLIQSPFVISCQTLLGRKNQDRKKHPVLIEAHRGNSVSAPENTLSAIKQALEIGVDRIEIDLQICKDNKLVVIHDHTLDRTTNGSGNVKDTTWKKIRTLDAGSWKSPEYEGLKIPSFEEVLELCKGHTMINIDLKDINAVPGMVKTIKEMDMENEIVITGKVPDCVDHVRKLTKNLTMFYENTRIFKSFLNDRKFKEAIVHAVKEAREYKLPGFLFHYQWINEDIVYHAHLHGLAVNVYGVNHEKELNKMLNAGVDGIMTDDPGFIKKLIN